MLVLCTWVVWGMIVLGGGPDAFGFELVVKFAPGLEVPEFGPPAVRPRNDMVDFAGPG